MTNSEENISAVTREMFSLIEGIKAGDIGPAEGDVIARAGYTIVKGAEVEISARIARANKTLRGDRR